MSTTEEMPSVVDFVLGCHETSFDVSFLNLDFPLRRSVLRVCPWIILDTLTNIHEIKVMIDIQRGFVANETILLPKDLKNPEKSEYRIIKASSYHHLSPEFLESHHKKFFPRSVDVWGAGHDLGGANKFLKHWLPEELYLKKICFTAKQLALVIPPGVKKLSITACSTTKGVEFEMANIAPVFAGISQLMIRDRSSLKLTSAKLVQLFQAIDASDATSDIQRSLKIFDVDVKIDDFSFINVLPLNCATGSSIYLRHKYELGNKKFAATMHVKYEEVPVPMSRRQLTLTTEELNH